MVFDLHAFSEDIWLIAQGFSSSLSIKKASHTCIIFITYGSTNQVSQSVCQARSKSNLFSVSFYCENLKHELALDIGESCRLLLMTRFLESQVCKLFTNDSKVFHNTDSILDKEITFTQHDSQWSSGTTSKSSFWPQNPVSSIGRLSKRISHLFSETDQDTLKDKWGIYSESMTKSPRWNFFFKVAIQCRFAYWSIQWYRTIMVHQ